MIRGKDLGILTAAADRIVERMRTIPGLRDAAHTMSARRPEYHIRLLRDSAGRLGITAGQLGSAVRAATLGLVATRLHEEAGGTDIRVRVSKRDISGPKELGAISVPNPKRLAEAEALAVRFQAEGTAPAGTLENALPVGSAGALAEPPAAFRVDQIATVRKGQGPILIQRENQARQVTVMANISGRDLGSVVKDIRPVLAEVANGLPPGTTVEFGGQYTEMQETLSIMAGAILLAALLMFMLIAAEFESFLQPLIIMATVPLGFIGVVAAVFLSGKTLSLPVLVGFIILEGIADNNAIVMIESINRLKAAGMDHRAAIVEGSAIRLRPVLITALTTVLGVLPMAFRAGSGTELRSPMAVAVLGGLVVTTFMTLFIVPILLSLTGRSGGRAGESVP
jgi:HAE1 family hydrophobic/amphiphilic exporter-1